MTPRDPRYLFVYGTLMRASRSPYARLLQARAQFIGEASAPGRLYRLGRFPGAVFDTRCRAFVQGEVFRLNGASLLVALDAYEGCGGQGTKPDLFFRDIVEVQLARGGALAAWAYPFAGNVSGRPFIASGRFRAI
ncbi:MAG: gamma-glutamylcyclotransferase [Rhodomicrobium sp.]